MASVTILSILACGLLLWFSGKAKAMTAHDNTTGHVWDGDLREMNNPLPRWWVWLFVITIVFALAYLAMYPGLGSSAGKLGWTQIGQYQSEVDKGNAEVAPLYAKFAAMTPEDVSRDPQAKAIGERLFMNNCSQCHGSDARGSKGFPNLTDCGLAARRCARQHHRDPDQRAHRANASHGRRGGYCGRREESGATMC